MIFSGVSWLAFSQQDPVLMRVNGKDVLRSEFEYYYNKDAASFASGYVAPEKYAEKFVDFKLKVSAAETYLILNRLGYDFSDTWKLWGDVMLPRQPVWIRLFRFVRRLKITAIG